MPRPELTYWDVTQRGATWTWTETPPPGDYSGLKTVGPGVLRWGTNLIEDDETFKNEFDADILTKLDTSTTQTLDLADRIRQRREQFRRRRADAPTGSSATEFESQAVLADSGGGMFVKVGDPWQLGGHDLVGRRASQPARCDAQCIFRQFDLLCQPAQLYRSDS